MFGYASNVPIAHEKKRDRKNGDRKKRDRKKRDRKKRDKKKRHAPQPQNKPQTIPTSVGVAHSDTSPILLLHAGVGDVGRYGYEPIYASGDRLRLEIFFRSSIGFAWTV